MKKIGFIGYGLRSETMMKAFTGAGLPLAPAAVADPRLETLQPQLARDGRFADTRYYADAEEMLDREALDAVFIGTRCGLHARYAALVMERGLPLFLEKPVCIDEAQYARLLAAPPAQRGRVMVSFPLHVTCIVQEMKRLVDSGALGDVVSVQAVNNVPYGGVYYHSWYRDAALTGGLFLQHPRHRLYYSTPGKRPVSGGLPITSKMYFKGNKPAGLHCPDCPEYRTCPESSFVVEHRRKEEPSGELCCFARDTGNEDVGAALFTCEDGTLISYHQTFLVKNDAGRRGARFIGTRASAEFDFYTAQLRVDYYDERHTAVHQFHYPEGLVHFGGDEALARGFAEMLEGAPSPLGLEHGLASAAACLAARRAAQTHPGGNHRIRLLSGAFPQRKQEQSRRSAPAPYKIGYGDAAFSPQRPVCSAGRHTHPKQASALCFSA